VASALSSPRAWALASCALLQLAACGRSEAPPPTPAPSDEPPLGALAEARRPDRRFIMQRLGERCELRQEASSGERIVEPERVACPRDLEDGEAIRLTGRTCLREGGPNGVQMPIGCPDDLLELEAAWRERKSKPAR